MSNLPSEPEFEQAYKGEFNRTSLRSLGTDLDAHLEQ